MQITITHNMDDLAGRLHATAGAMEDLVEQGVMAAAAYINEVAAVRIQDIYDAPIPVSKTGRPLWVRKGELQRGLAVTYPTRNAALIDIRGTAAVDYSDRRHQLGVTWFPKAPAGGIIRYNPWFLQAVEEGSTEALVQFDRVFATALNAKLGGS